MKEELLRVLNNKLNDINNDIDALVDLNDKIANQEDELSYIREIVNIFKEVLTFSATASP